MINPLGTLSVFSSISRPIVEPTIPRRDSRILLDTQGHFQDTSLEKKQLLITYHITRNKHCLYPNFVFAFAFWINEKNGQKGGLS